MFTHHPDGIIYIHKQAIDLAVFRRFAPEYALPEGFIGRIYEPGRKHALIRANGAQVPAGEWPEGDRYIAEGNRIVQQAVRLLERQAAQRVVNEVARSRRTVEDYYGNRQQQSRFRAGIGGAGRRDDGDSGKGA